MKHKKAVEVLSALAQESRLSIYLLLLEIGETGLPAGDIAKKLDISDTTLSFHLAQLKSAKLIRSHKQGRFVIYAANMRRAKKLSKLITGKEKKEL